MYLEAAERLLGELSAGAGALVAPALVDSASTLRDDTGRRWCPLTPSGAPFEASFSLSATDPGASRRVRFSAVAGTKHKYFASQLKVQRQVVDRSGGWLPAKAEAVWQKGTSALLDGLYPDPAQIPARTRLVTALGVVTEPSAGVAGLRLYANADGDLGGAGRLAAIDDDFAHLEEQVRRCQLVPHLAAVEVRADGSSQRRVYGISLPGQLREVLDSLFPGRFAALSKMLSDVGTDPAALDDLVYVCLATDGDALSVTVHVGNEALAAHGSSSSAVVERLVGQMPDGKAVHDRWKRAMETTGAPWDYTVVGLEVLAGGGVGKLNVYVAPA